MALKNALTPAVWSHLPLIHPAWPAGAFAAVPALCSARREPRRPAVHRTAHESDRLGYAVQGEFRLMMDGGLQDRPCLGVSFSAPHLLQILQADAGKELVPTPYLFCIRHEGRRGSGDLNLSVFSRNEPGSWAHLSGSLVKIPCPPTCRFSFFSFPSRSHGAGNQLPTGRQVWRLT